MPKTTLELDKTYTSKAIDLAMASIRRSITAASNPAIKQILEQDLALYQRGKDTLSESK